MPKPDFKLLGYNMRFSRLLANLTQKELAQRANIDTTTVYRLERGMSVTDRTLKSICKVLNIEIQEASTTKQTLNIKSENQPYIIHRAQDAVWIAHDDKRRNVPPESQFLIQDVHERTRLGSVGLVSMFRSGLSFIMPGGPGVVFEEIFGQTRFGGSGTYRDCVLYCLQGEVLVRTAEESFEIGPGDAIGYSTSFAFTMEPLRPLGPHDPPPLFFRVGANRGGKMPKMSPEVKKRTNGKKDRSKKSP